MPLLWKIGLAILVVCLVASMAIAIVRLATTPTEVGGEVFLEPAADARPRR
jgi:hypothetical protein